MPQGQSLKLIAIMVGGDDYPRFFHCVAYSIDKLVLIVNDESFIETMMHYLVSNYLCFEARYYLKCAALTEVDVKGLKMYVSEEWEKYFNARSTNHLCFISRRLNLEVRYFFLVIQ